MIRINRKKIRLLLLLCSVIFNFWMWYSFQSAGLPPDTWQNNAQLQVTNSEQWILFSPAHPSRKVVLFYPGGIVDPDAYAPLCRSIAAQGHETRIIKMPWRMANLGYTIPKDSGLLGDNSKEYILIGHSKGAAMAARFAYENPTMIDKLVLIGTTHPKDQDLSRLTLPVMKIYGSHDGVADERSVEANKRLLPSATTYVRIEGGNHAQFGYYGNQLGDNSALITREEQHAIVVKNIISFIETDN